MGWISTARFRVQAKLAVPCHVMALEVWTLIETRRVLREEPAGEGRELQLAAARGETEGFQLILAR